MAKNYLIVYSEQLATDTVIDAVVALVVRKAVVSTVKKRMKLILENKSLRNTLITKAFDFFLYDKIGKKLFWGLCKVGFIIAGKPSALGTITGNVFKGYLNNLLSFKSTVLSRSSSLISAFSSIGGLVAFLADFIDRQWNYKVVIKY